MKKTGGWQQFVNSGKVEDYLRFREMECRQDGRAKDENLVVPYPTSAVKEHIVMGEYPYAGVGEINRDRAEDSADRRI